MQKVATENNLSETAFVTALENKRYKLRWFTPTKEVELCGHATLAAAHALFELGIHPIDKLIAFETLYSGTLTAQRSNTTTEIELNFPVIKVEKLEVNETDMNSLLQGLGITRDEVLFVGKTIYDYIVEISSTAFHGICDVDFNALATIVTRGIVVTCKGPYKMSSNISRMSDFVSRCFFPRYTVHTLHITS
jgi:PhzF family phenazine biosynthesis protein